MAAFSLFVLLLTSVGCGHKKDPPVEITGKVEQLYPTAFNNAGAIVGSIRFPDKYPSFLIENDKRSELAVPPEAAWVYPLGINDAGEVVGYASRRDNGSRHAILWQKGRPIWLDDASAMNSEARAINAQGVVVGFRVSTGGRVQATQWRNGVREDITPANSPSWRPNGINARGEVVGWGTDAVNRPHLYVWRQNRLSDLGAGYHIAINNRGQIAGDFLTPDGRLHACVWNGTTRRELPLPTNAKATRVYSINDQGQIVGSADVDSSSASPDNAPIPIRWGEDTVLDLNYLRPRGADYMLEEAVAINNRGQILCTARRGKWGRTTLLTSTKAGCLIKVY